MSEDRGPAAARRLGSFEILREIGRGGTGIVHEARQVFVSRKVAFTALSSQIGLSSKAVPRSHREAEAAAELHRADIVPIHATGEQDGTHYYAMELIEGPVLDQDIQQVHAPIVGKEHTAATRAMSEEAR
jgi:serine/threonine protein kinase